MPAEDQVIVVEHYQRFPGDPEASKFILGLFNYYNDKSLRHVFQHYIDVANDPGKRTAGRRFESSDYWEDQKSFRIKFTDDMHITAHVRLRRCVTTLPVWPFKPRSPEEAKEMEVEWVGERDK